MVVQQGAQLSLQGAHAWAAGGDEGIQRIRIGQCGLQGLPVRGSQSPFVGQQRTAQAAFGLQKVGRSRLQRGQGVAFFAEHGQVAGFFQQQQLEGAQHAGVGLAPLRQPLHGLGIGVEKRRVGFVAHQQAHQHFIEIGASQQGFAHGHDVTAAPLGGFEGAHFALPAPRQQQRLQWQQHRAQLRCGAFGPFGHQGQAAMLARKHLNDQAGFAPVVAVQDKGGLIQKPPDAGA